MNEIYERIQDKIEEAGYNVEITIDPQTRNGFFSFETWTDSAGENVIIEFDFTADENGDNLRNMLYQYASDFDVDDYAMPYIEARGTHGIPTSIRTILDSAEEVGEIYNEVSRIVNTVR